MRYQRQILQVRWFDFISTADFTTRTELPSLADTINHRRLSLFGHVARMDPGTPAHHALDCAVARRMERQPVPTLRLEEALRSSPPHVNSTNRSPTYTVVPSYVSRMNE